MCSPVMALVYEFQFEGLDYKPKSNFSQVSVWMDIICYPLGYCVVSIKLWFSVLE